MWYHGRDLEVVRHHLRLGFYGGSDGRGHTWEAVNIAGCWATAESETNKWIAHDVVHVAGGLTGTITNLHGVENWTSTEADCLNIGDMEVDPDPAPLDATVLQIGAGDEEEAEDDNEDEGADLE